MSEPRNEAAPTASNLHLVLAYVADLELEVDRLRKQEGFVQHEARKTLKRIHRFCTAAPAEADGQPVLAEIDQAARQLASLLRDLREPPGYHPAHDQVIAIAVRPLVEQVFRWQQRLGGAAKVVLRLELGTEHVEWFPARLRHILDNLIAGSLRYHDPDKNEAWVRLELQQSPKAYQLTVSDNGTGLPAGAGGAAFGLLYRAAAARSGGPEVGLAVAKLLVEQSGGTLNVDSGPGRGTTFVAFLPRYDVDDFLC